MFQKNDPFAFRLLSLPLFVSSSFPLFLSLSLCLFVSLSLRLFLSFPLSSSFFLLSLFNTHSARPDNSLKTKDLRERHFRLKILSQGKPLRIKTLGAKFAQYFSHFPADPTLHTPPKTDPTYSAAKPCTM